MRLYIAAAALALISGAAEAQLVANPVLGSAARGAEVFTQCAACHSFDPGAAKAGPTLHGLIGRRAGSVPGYDYSPAMRRSRVVWSEDTLSLFLSDPQRFVRRDKRAAACRVADPASLGDLLAYLEQASR